MPDLEEVLKNYGISGKITAQTRGPLLKIVSFTPAPGTKLKNISAVSADIRREWGVSSLAIEQALDSRAVLFEVPADTFETVDFNAVINNPAFKTAAQKYALPLALGVNIQGEPVYADLAKMPHLLVGGTTGSGKSVGLNSFILSLIAARRPNEVKFVLIDPKRIEFSTYNNQKYLYCPVITESDEAAAALSYLAAEMDRRYEIFAENMSKNLAEYNASGSGFLPYIVCVIDEFADLTAQNKEVEKDVLRLAQKARAAGIHLILATQRPSVDIVTGVLKANFPTRLAYKTASQTDSRTILDATGAENLIGRGDSLFLHADGSLQRLHGAYLQDSEIVSLLKPYAGKVKPLPLTTKNTEKPVTKGNKQTPSKQSKVNILVRAWRFWNGLRVKDQQLIIRWGKYLFTFLIGFISNSQKKKK